MVTFAVFPVKATWFALNFSFLIHYDFTGSDEPFREGELWEIRNAEPWILDAQ